MYDVMKAFAVDGPETSEEAEQRVDGLAQELRSAGAAETVVALTAQIAWCMRDFVAAWKAYLAGIGATNSLSEWATGQLLCQDWTIGETSSIEIEAQVRALGRLANMPSRRRSLASTTRRIGTLLLSTPPQETLAHPGEEALGARQPSQFYIGEPPWRRSDRGYGQ